ncbi:MAG: hypothetical protein M3270_06625, partial [Thermoproteota archaeon]|nr:hypothetical protein [Thermoproteota archaeon]
MAYDVNTNNLPTASTTAVQTGRPSTRILNLARQKVEFATAQNAFGNGVPMIDTMSEALPAFGIAVLIAAAGGVGGTSCTNGLTTG